MCKKIIYLVALTILLSFVLIQITSDLETGTVARFNDYTPYQSYLLGKEFTIQGAFPIVFLNAEIVDIDGKRIDKNETPFEWEVWIDNDSLAGAVKVNDKDLQMFDENIEGYKVEEKSFKMVQYVKRTTETSDKIDYYIKLSYRLLGIKHYKIVYFVTM